MSKTNKETVKRNACKLTSEWNEPQKKNKQRGNLKNQEHKCLNFLIIRGM